MSTYLCVRCNAGVLQLRADVSAPECASLLDPHTVGKSLEERLLLTAAGVFGEAPLCEVCMQSGISEMSREVETLRQELLQARQTLGELGTSEESDISALEAEMAELSGNLSALDVREEKLRQKLRELMTEERKLQETSEAVFGRWLEVQERAMETDSQNVAVDRKIRNLREDLRNLKRLNVVDAIFKISTDHEFGLINGLRLGKSPAIKFPEINAALGQMALLVQHMQSRTTALSSESGLRVVPRGSFSYLIDLEGERHDLFMTSELSGGVSSAAGRLWSKSNRKFDVAMQGLLGVVQELLLHCLRVHRNLRIPYKIELPEKIGNCSVNLQFQGEVQWTQAMKYLLTNLKFLLLHINTTNPQ